MQLSFGGFVIEEVQVDGNGGEKSEKDLRFGSVHAIERGGSVGATTGHEGAD